jgi:hypothetical protein
MQPATLAGQKPQAAASPIAPVAAKEVPDSVGRARVDRLHAALKKGYGIEKADPPKDASGRPTLNAAAYKKSAGDAANAAGAAAPAPAGKP